MQKTPYSECIDSILQQTYLNFEIIALDDGSTDRSVEVLNSYTDERIKLYRCRHNYIRNLNRGLSLCKGKYIARMDADDKMCNRRIEKQVEILEKYEQSRCLLLCNEIFRSKRRNQIWV